MCVMTFCSARQNRVHNCHDIPGLDFRMHVVIAPQCRVRLPDVAAASSMLIPSFKCFCYLVNVAVAFWVLLLYCKCRCRLLGIAAILQMSLSRLGYYYYTIMVAIASRILLLHSLVI
jgi:hypothetical protein